MLFSDKLSGRLSRLLISVIFLMWFIGITSAQPLIEFKSKPHFANVFTQGLIINDNIVWESSGLYGRSLLTKWDLNTGKILKQKKIEAKYFAEGLTELSGHLFMLTWKKGIAFEIDKETLQTIKTHHYQGEGWGLTTNGRQLIMSNGTDSLQFINPQSFKVERVVRVHLDKTFIYNLNELEWINGMVWANVYQTDYIVVIDPATGLVTNKYHLPHLLKGWGKKPGVLNGIAYDKVQNKIWVTGKNWPLLFEL
ncbi:MAG: glutaminyl-peptide cyclotransferase [Alcanivoracaceae bacterium]|nr:glutaminyl-peptide cyclotransferase [Alcanivoracaceae bacterium]